MWRRNVAAAVIGILPGFFLVGPLIFADGSNSERLAVGALILLVYSLAGGLLGYFWFAWQPGLWFSLGGMAISLFFSLADGSLWALAVLLVLPAAASVAALLGSRLRNGGAG